MVARELSPLKPSHDNLNNVRGSFRIYPSQSSKGLGLVINWQGKHTSAGMTAIVVSMFALARTPGCTLLDCARPSPGGLSKGI